MPEWCGCPESALTVRTGVSRCVVSPVCWLLKCYGAQSVRDEQLGEQKFCNIIIMAPGAGFRVGWERILRLYYDSLSPTGTRQQRGSGRAHTPGPHARGEGAWASRENPNLETWVSRFTFTKWRRASPPDHSSANSWRQTLTLGRQVMA